MDSTLEKKKYKKRNWKYVRFKDRDIRLFRLILEQKFLTRPQVIKHVFRNQRYGKDRIWKLKTFGYLKPCMTLAGEPESYLLGPKGVEALRAQGYEIGKDLPKPQQTIEISTYEHDRDVSEVRFLFESLGYCHDWKSEKVLRAGTQGERKVPDGFFAGKGVGIAIEVEHSEKAICTYRKIFEIYQRDPKIHYVFYVCKEAPIRDLVLRLFPKPRPDRTIFCCALFDELLKFREKTIFSVRGEEFAIEKVFGMGRHRKGRERT